MVNLCLFLHLNFVLGQRLAPITDHYIGDATAFVYREAGPPLSASDCSPHQTACDQSNCMRDCINIHVSNTLRVLFVA